MSKHSVKLTRLTIPNSEGYFPRTIMEELVRFGDVRRHHCRRERLALLIVGLSCGVGARTLTIEHLGLSTDPI